MTGNALLAMSLFLQVSPFGSAGDWNGLSHGMDTAKEARVSVLQRGALNLSELDGREIVVLIQPPDVLPVVELEQFMQDGGTLLLFAEGQSATGLLSRYGISWASPPLSHDAYFRNSPTFPIFSRTKEPSLFFNMNGNASQLLGNRPAGLELEKGARGVHILVPYAGPEEIAFVVEVTVGLGRLLVVADASVMINEMQGRHGNKQFLANVLRRHCLKEPCAAVWTPPGAPVQGQYTPRPQVPGTWSSLVEDVLERARQAMMDPKLIITLGFVLLLGMLLGAGEIIRREKAAARRVNQAEEFITDWREKERNANG